MFEEVGGMGDMEEMKGIPAQQGGKKGGRIEEERGRVEERQKRGELEEAEEEEARKDREQDKRGHHVSILSSLILAP